MDSRTVINLGVTAAVIGAAVIIGFMFSGSDDKKKSKTPKKKSSASSKSAVSEKKHDSSSEKLETIDDSGLDDCKGYKVLNNGKKTTYFHRDVSDKEKSLIGDCSPRPLGQQCESPTRIASQTSSAWNSAGTFEEKNIIEWSKKTLSKLLKETKACVSSNITNNDVSISVNSVGSISGDSFVTFSRGKKKYIYDLSTEIQFQLVYNSTKGERSIFGSASLNDITSDCSYEFAFTCSSSHKEDVSIFNQCILGKNSSSKTFFKQSLIDSCNQFLEEVKSTY